MLRTLAALISALLVTTAVAAQEAKPAEQTPEEQNATSKPKPGEEPKPINVKLDFTITDQTGDGQPGKRTVSMIVADRRNGMIRTAGRVLVSGERYTVTLNIDARPAVLEDNRVLLNLGLEYAPKPVDETATTGEGRANLNQHLSVIVVPGKPMVVSQASDPTSDRKIGVELMTTILK